MKTIASKGSVLEVLYIALPMLISNSCETVMTFTDRVFLASLDGHLMNGVMLGGISQFAIVIIFVSIVSYATALVAQYYGAKRFGKCSVILTQALIVGIISYPIILAIGQTVIAHLFENSKIHPTQLAAQVDYFNILIRFSIFTLIRVSLVSFFSGVGKTKTIMVSSIASMVTNVGANWVLIFGHFGFDPMGAKGAAYGTVVGIFTGVIILLSQYLKKENIETYQVKDSLTIYVKGIKRLLRYGYPIGIGTFLNFFAFNVIVGLYHEQGPVAASAITITYSWDMIFFVPLLGVEIAIVSLVGRYIGAEDMLSLDKTIKSVMKMSFIYSIVMIIVIMITPGYLVDLFRPVDNIDVFIEARPYILIMIRLIAIYVIAEVVRVVFTGILKGAGDTFMPMFITMLVHWIAVGTTWIGFYKLNLSITWVWFWDVIITVIAGISVYFRFKMGNWRRIRILKY